MCKEQAPVKCRGYCGCCEGNLLDSVCPRHLSAGQRALHSTATRRTHEGRWRGMVRGLVRKGNTGHAAPALFCEPYESSDFIECVCICHWLIFYYSNDVKYLHNFIFCLWHEDCRGSFAVAGDRPQSQHLKGWQHLERFTFFWSQWSNSLTSRDMQVEKKLRNTNTLPNDDPCDFSGTVFRI